VSVLSPKASSSASSLISASIILSITFPSSTSVPASLIRSHWSSVKEKPLSIALISTKFVKPFSDIKLEFDTNFSLNAQNLGLIFC